MDDEAKKLQAHQALQDLWDATNASYDAAASDAQRDKLDKIADTTTASLTELNRLDMQSRTADLNAAEEPLATCMAKLATLQSELNAISADFAKAAAICSGIDKAISDVSAVFAV